MFKYLLYQLAQFLATRLSLKQSYQLATWLSDFQYVNSFRDRRAVTNNLKKILPAGKDCATATREVFRNFGKYLVEFLRMEKMVEPAFVAEHITVEGDDNLRKVLTQGKGAIIITAHIGNWELGAVMLSLLKYPVMAVALPHKERPVNDLFNRKRQVRGLEVVPIDGAIRRCIAQLRANKVIAIVADRDFSVKGGEVVDFLGHKTLIPKGAATFSKRTGAPILPTFLLRKDDNTFYMTIEEPIFPDEVVEADVAEHEAVLAIMRRYLAIIEERIRAYPTQWLMFREFPCHAQEETVADGKLTYA